MLVLAWLFPLLAVVDRTIFESGYGVLTPPGVGLHDSSRSLLLLLTLGAYCLSHSKKVGPKNFHPLMVAFLAWTLLSAWVAQNTVGSLFFCMTWFAAAFVFVSLRRLAPTEWTFTLRALLLHLPLSLVALFALSEVMIGNSIQVSEPFQLSNVYSNWLLMFLPLVILDIHREKGLPLLLALGSGALSIGSIMLTYSRTSWILTMLEFAVVTLLLFPPPKKRLLGLAGFILTGLLAAVLFRSQLGGLYFLLALAGVIALPLLAEVLGAQRRSSTCLRLALVIGVGALLVVGVSHFNEEVQIRDRATGRLNNFVRGDRSTEVRLELWKSCFKMSLANPILGVGPSNFSDAYPQHQKHFSVYSDSPHATTLELFAEVGWVGGLLFCALLFYFLSLVAKTKNLSEIQSAALVGLFFGLGHAQSDVSYQYATLWTSLAVLAALALPRDAIEEQEGQSNLAGLLFFLVATPAICYLWALQSRLEQTKLMSSEFDIYTQASSISDEIPIWAEPALQALYHGNYLLLKETDPQRRKLLEDQLLPLVQRVLKHYPGNATAHRMAGEYHRLGKRYKEAQTQLSESLRLDPFNYPMTYHQLFLLAQETGDKAESDRLAKEILELYNIEELQTAHSAHRDQLTRQLVPVLVAAAEWMNPFENPVQTEAAFRFLVEQRDTARNNYSLGACLWAQQKYDEAYIYLERAHLLNSGYPKPPKR